MKLNFSLRTFLLVVAAFAVVAAIHAKIKAAVSKFESKVQGYYSIQADATEISDKLMRDAGLKDPHRFCGMGSHNANTGPAVLRLEPKLIDLILFRRQIVVPFKHSSDFTIIDRENTYLITPFGVNLIGSEKKASVVVYW